jgi:hypothetical protein
MTDKDKKNIFALLEYEIFGMGWWTAIVPTLFQGITSKLISDMVIRKYKRYKAASRVGMHVEKRVITFGDLPIGAYNLELFHIDAENKPAYLGYYLRGDFHYEIIRYDPRSLENIKM